ncbi:formate dehydrogenase [Marinobacter halodurans]|uniref:Formate dehydrogenase n=2 Tax=Marinobacter halodurans TaxID=2528979 RepID=A0ABY1ZQT7_9GAMM|nr:formate dehydrogenase [Marinobacter halodurans]
MINQISDNNLHHGEAEHAAEMVATHLIKFWARSMKDQIISYAENDGSELNQVSKLAVERLKAWRQAKAS